MSSIYTFLTKITGNAFFEAGSIWVIIEFSRSYSAKLNRKGALVCEQGNTTLSRTHCEWNGDRRIKLLSNQKIDNYTAGYKFVVHGVEQPNAFTHDEIYFSF